MFLTSRKSYSRFLMFYKFLMKRFSSSCRLRVISGPLVPPKIGILILGLFLANCSWPSQISLRSLHLWMKASFSANMVSSLSRFHPFLEEFFLIRPYIWRHMVFHSLQQAMLSSRSMMHFSTSPSSMSSLLIWARHLLMIWFEIFVRRPFILSSVL